MDFYIQGCRALCLPNNSIDSLFDRKFALRLTGEKGPHMHNYSPGQTSIQD